MAEDTPDGIALTFITSGELPPLRARVRALAVHLQSANTSARVQDIANGAQIVFTPDTRDHLAPLRALVRKRAEYMASGRCNMP